MDSSKNTAQTKLAETSAFAGWGAFVGAAIGLIIGLFAKAWIEWTTGAGVIGLLVGAFIDRARRH